MTKTSSRGMFVSLATASALILGGWGADTRSTSTPTTVRPDRFDSALNFGGLDDPSSALPSQAYEAAYRSTGLVSGLPAPFALAIDVARTRDGRTRAPPQA